MEAIGQVKVILYDENGSRQVMDERNISIPATGKKSIPVSINLPKQPGGYLVVAEFSIEDGEKVFSRRYIKVGDLPGYKYFDISY